MPIDKHRVKELLDRAAELRRSAERVIQQSAELKHTAERVIQQSEELIEEYQSGEDRKALARKDKAR